MPKKLYNTEKEQEKTFLVSISVNNAFNPEESLVELAALAKANDLEVLGQMHQRTNLPSVQFLIGTGKLDELKNQVQTLQPDIIIFDNELSGMRIKNLENELDCKVIDRSMLILDIFAKRAKSSEGKLQVELAQLKYMSSRLVGLTASNNKYGGGVGMRGPGETKLELDRRRMSEQMDMLSEKLKKLERQKEITRKSRVENRVKSVALVGYTNSGKSTLLNTLTKSDAFAKDMLFATLDTTSRNLWFEYGKQAVITDTVGFVSKLPHAFVEAFKSTLKETVDADLLVIVVDISSLRAELELQIVFDVLTDLHVVNKPYIIALNKIDKGIIKHSIKDNFENVIDISAKENTNIDVLRNKMQTLLFM